MSTKIYNGYKLPNMSLLELKDYINKLRQKMHKVSEDIFVDRVRDLTVKMIDYSYIFSKEEFLKYFKIEDKDYFLKFSLIFTAREIIENKYKQMQAGQVFDPKYDFSSQLCLVPMEDKILCLYFGEAPEFLEAFESFKEVESYYYRKLSRKPTTLVVGMKAY